MIPILLAFACLPVDGPKLLARHLATAVAAFTQLAPDTEIGYAPVPGAVRVMHPDELQRIERRFGIPETAAEGDLCFQWPMGALDAERVSSAMRNSLPPDTRIEVLEISKIPVPNGALEFPIAGLQGAMWRGSVRYSETGRFDVWARVKVTAKQKRIVALTSIRAGETLSADKLRLEEVEDTPASGLVTSIEEAAGLVAKRSLAAGTVLQASYLDQPCVVAKGDNVRLHASVGNAHVTTSVSAEAQGRVGDIIPVKNASSGRVMRARIEAPGK